MRSSSPARSTRRSASSDSGAPDDECAEVVAAESDRVREHVIDGTSERLAAHDRDRAPRIDLVDVGVGGVTPCSTVSTAAIACSAGVTAPVCPRPALIECTGTRNASAPGRDRTGVDFALTATARPRRVRWTSETRTLSSAMRTTDGASTSIVAYLRPGMLHALASWA